MQHLTYIGSHDEVEIPDARAIVARGQAFAVADPDLAASLLEQVDNFRKATGPEVKAADKAASVDDAAPTDVEA